MSAINTTSAGKSPSYAQAARATSSTMTRLQPGLTVGANPPPTGHVPLTRALDRSPVNPLPEVRQRGTSSVRPGRDEALPEFSTLNIGGQTQSSLSPATSISRGTTCSMESPVGRVEHCGSPQTPPSASSFTLRTPHTHDTRSSEFALAQTLYGTRTYGSPSDWSYDPSPKRPGMAVSPPVSIMGEEKIGRFLLVSDIPQHIDEQAVCTMLQGIASLKALIATFKDRMGYVIVVFYDPREAIKVYNHLRARPARFQGVAEEVILHCRPISKDEVKEAIRGYPDAEKVFENSESQILVEVVQGRSVTREAVLSCLEEVGDVMTLEIVGRQGYGYKAEFYDTRMAYRAVRELNGLAAAGGRLKVTYHIPPRDPSFTLASASQRSDLFGPPKPASSHPFRSSTASQQQADVFGPVAGTAGPYPQMSYPTTPGGTRALTFRKHVSQPLTPSTRYEGGYAGHSLPTTPLHLTAMARRLSEPGMIADLASRADISARSRIGQGLGGVPRSPSQAIPEQNRVFPERVFAHLDSRTSVMVKDVPNKLSRQGLIDVLNEVVPGEFDFVYLRFDFNNCCNVGYAFVNFTTVDALYHFIQTKVGRKWNLFSSEKVLQISYANIQGKQNLINKFRNSAVMSVMEQWRPQIFYSDGAKKGLPEPFPMADNANIMRRSHEARLAQLSEAPATNPGNAYNDPNVYQYDEEFDTSSFDAHYGF